MEPLNILVIGTGVYTVGRGTPAFGTVMPALFEWQRTRGGGEIIVAGTTPESVAAARGKIDQLRRIMGVEPGPIRYLPEAEGSQPDPDAEAYLEAIRRIPRPACAIIVTPDHLHRPMAGAAIKAGLHTLVVKPLAPTVREVAELVALQKQHRVYCAVEFHKRFDDANLKLKDAILTGQVGDPLYVLVQFSQRKSVPSVTFRKWADQTNIFQFLGIHYIDVIYFATGARPIRAIGVGQKNWLCAQGIDTYDAVQGVIEWEMPAGTRFMQYILTNWIDPEKTSAMSEQNIKVIGTRGRFESDQKRRGVTVVTDEHGIEEPNPYFTSPIYDGERTVYRGYGIDSINTFLNDASDVQEGRVSIEALEGKRPTFRQSIVPVAVLEAVNQSLRSGSQWVEIPAQASG